jgi:3-oxoacyl-[acyl-carrier protein] reductase
MFARRADVLEQESSRVGGIAVAGDVRDASDRRRLVDTTVERFGGVDILVNNSGGPRRGNALDMGADDVRDAVELLLVSAVELTLLCVPHLRSSGHGRVIHVESSTIREPTPALALSNAVRRAWPAG